MNYDGTSRRDIEILLVEDDPHDAELAMRALKKGRLAHQVTWARDGVEALELIFGPTDDPAEPIRLVPKVVLLDLKLPRVNGLQVLERLKGDLRSRAIPVVVLTSSSEETDVLWAYQMGVNSYIVKPVDFDKFASVVQQLGLYWLLLNEAPKATVA